MLRFTALLLCLFGSADAAFTQHPTWAMNHRMEDHLSQVAQMQPEVAAHVDSVLHAIAPSAQRRSNGGIDAQTCAQLDSMTASQVSAAMAQDNPGQPVTPDSCIIPLMDFMKIMCSEQCKSSPLLSTISTGSRRVAKGGRQLLGGDASTQDPAVSCKDPCFEPFMSNMLAMMKVVPKPECKSLYGDSSTRRGVGRALLGGSSADPTNMKVMEITFGMLCAKNSEDKYCMTLFQRFTDDGHDHHDGHDHDHRRKDHDSAPSCPEIKQRVGDWGCCWGNMELIFAAGAATAQEASDQEGPTLMEIRQQAAACGVTLASVPCAGTVKIAAVKVVTELAGITAAQFSGKHTTYTRTLARVAGLTPVSVAITAVSGGRRANLVVESQVRLIGDEEVVKLAAVKGSLSDTSSLSQALQTADPSFSAISVVASTSADAYTSNIDGSLVATTASSSDSNTGMIIGIVVGCAAVVLLIGGGVYYFKVVLPGQALDMAQGGAVQAVDSLKDVDSLKEITEDPTEIKVEDLKADGCRSCC